MPSNQTVNKNFVCTLSSSQLMQQIYLYLLGPTGKIKTRIQYQNFNTIVWVLRVHLQALPMFILACDSYLCNNTNNTYSPLLVRGQTKKKHDTKTINTSRCMGTHVYFPTISTNGNHFDDFRFASLDGNALSHLGYVLKESKGNIIIFTPLLNRAQLSKKEFAKKDLF